MRVARPAALLWDHNAHYHALLLRQLPPRVDRALDAGCGSGAFARKLAARARFVDAVDIAPGMIASARAAHADARNITWIGGDVLSLDLPLVSYDAVTSIASLHHMPLDAALARFGALVRPGGTLAVLGLCHAATPADYAVRAVTFAVDSFVGAALAVRGSGGKPHDGMPVRPPSNTLPEVRAAAARLLPESRLRRLLFHRYLLTWHRPG